MVLSILFLGVFPRLWSANSIGYGWWSMIYCCRFWSYEICWEFSKLWGLKYIFLIDVRIYLLYRCHKNSIQYLLLKGLHKYYIKICELFWDVKMVNGVLVQIQKTLDTERASILKHNCKHIFLLSQYIIKRVNFVLGYLIFLSIEKSSDKWACLFRGALKWECAYKNWTCWSVPFH